MDEFNQAMEYGFGACEKIYQLQKDALKRRYAVEDVEGLEEEVPRNQQELEG
jgi:exosome complex component RRP41